jgi:GNAT superfamily N-acetyltransferase
MVTIERIGPEGFARVRDIRLRALREAPDAFWTTADEEAATTTAEWRRRLARPDAVTFIACWDGVDIGLAVGTTHDGHPRDAALLSLWVAPEARGSGAGAALVGAVIDWTEIGLPCLAPGGRGPERARDTPVRADGVRAHRGGRCAPGPP